MATSLVAHQDWYCPSCGKTKQTAGVFRQNLLHPCPRLGGIDVPMVAAGTRAKVEAVERQDYVGRDIVPHDDRGRAIMAVVTTRDDGQDTAVFVPHIRGARVEASGAARPRCKPLKAYLMSRASRRPLRPIA